MPNPISGGYPVPRDLGQRLGGIEKAVAQLQRLMTKPQKLVASGGGGVVDVASVYTSAYVGIQWASGSSNLAYGTPSYSVSTTSGSASWLSVSGGDIAVTVDGFYEVSCLVDLRWSTQAAAPGASLSVYLNGDPSGAGAEYVPIYQAGTLWGVVRRFTNGPERLTSGQYWRLEADGAAASSADITKSSASWRIARYA